MDGVKEVRFYNLITFAAEYSKFKTNGSIILVKITR
jgi:hypothetical protein